MKRRKSYLSQTTVDIIFKGEDYILGIDDISIANTDTGSPGYDHDYVDSWSIVQVYDAFGYPLSKADSDSMMKLIKNNGEMMEYIQTDLDERLPDMMDGYDGDTDRRDE